ncbi:hypothetical protein [Cytobacillus gottheilii]|uniref:hypothetical protein n=1 Tax=Cytobacillus gottheilii TaxID=859144 RepID=UPI0009BB80CF|nr:hypothetical protein [Cytobacillus gottheilii]
MPKKNESAAEQNQITKGIITTIVEANIAEFDHIEMYKRMVFPNIVNIPFTETAALMDQEKQKIDVKVNVMVVNKLSVIQKLPELQEKIAEEISAFTGADVRRVDIAIMKYMK